MKGNPQIKDCNQHQQRTGDGIKRNLQGSGDLALATIQSNHKENRQEHNLPKDIKKDEIPCADSSGHGPLNNKKIPVISFGLRCKN